MAAQTKRPPPAAPAHSNHSAPHHDRWAWILLALSGHPVVATLKGGTRVRGILAAATPDQGDLSIALRHAAYLDPSPDASSSAAPPKPALLINGRDLVALEAADLALDLVGHPSSAASSSSSRPASSAAADARDSFRTDTDISGQARLGKERTLQAWGAGAGAGGADDSGWGAGAADDSLEGGGGLGGLSLEDEYAPSSNHHRRGVNGGNKPGKGWDQFAANERQFGLKTDYDDELYTTKLDRSGADFKAREARAAQLEREIMKGTSALANNAHVAEERGEQAPDDGTLNEEDRYGAVIRGEGAYVPPGARKAALARLQQGQQQQQQQNGAADATAAPAITTTAPPAAPAPAGSADAPSAQGGNGNGKDLQSSLQHFVTNERVRLEQRKAQMQQAQQQALAKKEQDSKLASLVQWSQTFKNPYPLSDELATILGKKPVSSTSAQKAPSTAGGASTGSPAVSPTATNRTAPSAPAKSPSPAPSAAASSALKKPFVAEIPPFDPARAKARQAASDAAHKAGGATSPAPAPAASAAPTPAAAAALQPKAPTSKLSATSAAFVFKPRASAAPFTPGASLGAGKPTSPAPPPAAPAAAAPIASSSAAAPPAAPASASTSTGAALNPFFGDKQIKKGSSSMHVKEDFTPFKTGVLAEPNSIAPQWSQFSGKPYRAIYPPQAHPLGIADEAAAAQAAQQAQQQAVQAHQAMQQQQAMQMAGGGAAGGPGGIMDPNSVAAIAQAQAAHHQQQQQHHHPQQQQQHHPHQHHQQQQQMHHHPHLQQHLHAAAVMGMHGGGGGMPPPPPPGAQGFNPGAPPFGAAPPFPGPGVGARGSVPPPPPFQGFVPPPPPPPHGAQGSPFPGPPPLPQGSAPMFASPPLAGTSPHPPHSMLAVAAQAQQANGMSSPPPGAGGVGGAAGGGGGGGARYMPWTPGQNPGMPPPPPPPQGFVPPPPPPQ